MKGGGASGAAEAQTKLGRAQPLSDRAGYGCVADQTDPNSFAERCSCGPGRCEANAVEQAERRTAAVEGAAEVRQGAESCAAGNFHPNMQGKRRLMAQHWRSLGPRIVPRRRLLCRPMQTSLAAVRIRRTPRGRSEPSGRCFGPSNAARPASTCLAVDVATHTYRRGSSPDGHNATTARRSLSSSLPPTRSRRSPLANAANSPFHAPARCDRYSMTASDLDSERSRL